MKVQNPHDVSYLLLFYTFRLLSINNFCKKLNKLLGIRNEESSIERFGNEVGAKVSFFLVLFYSFDF